MYNTISQFQCLIEDESQIMYKVHVIESKR
jgi:hypothetical protein